MYDFTLLAAMDLTNTLINDPSPVYPVPFKSRTVHVLPMNNVLQYEVDAVKIYSNERKMLLNPLKTKTMIFNTLLKYNVSPQILTEPGEYLDVVEEYKILGYLMRSDLKTISNTKYICQKVYKGMWIIRRDVSKLAGISSSKNNTYHFLTVLSWLRFPVLNKEELPFWPSSVRTPCPITSIKSGSVPLRSPKKDQGPVRPGRC